MIQLGTQCRDKITGFIGTVTARIEYLFGSTQYRIEDEYRSTGEDRTRWLEEGRLEPARVSGVFRAPEGDDQ